MPFRLCSRAPTISIVGSSMRAYTAGRARAGAEPSSIPARRGGGRGKRDPRRRSAGPCHPRAKAGMVRAVAGRAELAHGRLLAGGILTLPLAVSLVGIRKAL